MLFKNSSRLQLSFLIYLVVICIVIYIKPRFLYNKNGKLKPFGCGKQNTILPLWMIILLVAFISYYLAQVILFVIFVKHN